MNMKTLLVSLFFSLSLQAVTTLKLAVLVPEDTTWGDSLKKLSQEVSKVSNGQVQFKIYYGGVAGDEPDVLRKIRVGQMNGGIFTAKILGDIQGDVRVMEIPFSFYDKREKAWETLTQLAPQFNQALEKKGFVNLGFYEVGQIYVVSTKKVANLEALKGLKIWAWEGDALVKAMIESMGLVSVPLSITDVLSSLSTGIIDSAYASPLAMLALQWHTKIKYLVDFPVAYSVGSLLINQKDWNKISPEIQAKIKQTAQGFIVEANKSTVKENEMAREQLKKLGVEFISFPQKDYDHTASMRSEVVKKLTGKLFSENVYQQFEKIRK
jgi:TRAP-type transport system periplasmic protein